MSQREIWKWAVASPPGPREVTIEAPDCAEMLSADIQRGSICVWGIVHTEFPMARYRIIVCGTGQPIDDWYVNRKGLLATIQDGDRVWHVFNGGKVYEHEVAGPAAGQEVP